MSLNTCLTCGRLKSGHKHDCPEHPLNAVSVEYAALLAVAPFTPDAYGGMKDADGDIVITCDDECPPCTLYKERMVDADAWFMCSKCGRLGQRMEEASHRQVITAND